MSTPSVHFLTQSEETNDLDMLGNILFAQGNDPFCQLLLDMNISISVDDEYEVMGKYYDLNDIFDYLLEKYPFIVSIPEKYGDQVRKEGYLTPVSPSDNGDICGFKGTIGRDPFISAATGETRYLIVLNKKHIKRLYPYLLTGVRGGFHGVGFFPLAADQTLKLGQDYSIIGKCSANDIGKLKREALRSGIKYNISHII